MALDFLKILLGKPYTNKKVPISITPFALDNDKSSIFEVDFLQKGIVYSYYLELSKKILFRKS